MKFRTGIDKIQIEVYQQSPAAHNELFKITRLMGTRGGARGLCSCYLFHVIQEKSLQ